MFMFTNPNIIVKVVTNLYWSLNKALTLSAKGFSVCKVKRHSINCSHVEVNVLFMCDFSSKNHF